MPLYLIPKNWTEFQHYKYRNPPWIKLQRSIIDDHDFQTLPLASRALAPMLWCLAGAHADGYFEFSIQRLAFRLRWPEVEIENAINPLLEAGFFTVCDIDASAMLAMRKRSAIPETETETETEKTSHIYRGKDSQPRARKKRELFDGGTS